MLTRGEKVKFVAVVAIASANRHLQRHPAERNDRYAEVVPP
jgi:hypothetical protein